MDSSTTDIPSFSSRSFQKLGDDIHTLRNELVPTDGPALSAFLSGYTKRPIPRFDLSIKHGCKGTPPRELIRIAYTPDVSSPSSEFIDASLEGCVQSEYDWERLEALYRRDTAVPWW
jgi:hypothetical protein